MCDGVKTFMVKHCIMSLVYACLVNISDILYILCIFYFLFFVNSFIFTRDASILGRCKIDANADPNIFLFVETHIHQWQT